MPRAKKTVSGIVEPSAARGKKPRGAVGILPTRVEIRIRERKPGKWCGYYREWFPDTPECRAGVDTMKQLLENIAEDGVRFSFSGTRFTIEFIDVPRASIAAGMAAEFWAWLPSNIRFALASQFARMNMQTILEQLKEMASPKVEVAKREDWLREKRLNQKKAARRFKRVQL